MTVKEKIHRLVDDLAEDQAGDLLDYAEWLAASTDSLSAEELAAMARSEREVEAGEYVSLDDLKRTLGA